MSQLITPEKPEWKEWLELCNYTGWNPDGPLKPMKYRGRVICYSRKVGVGPTFFNELLHRINKVQPIRMAIVGEAGVGKTYTAIDIARVLDLKFSIEQVVITAKDYMRLVRKIKPKKPIVLEEPTFHLAARTWFKDWQRIIVQTIESTRFQNNPLLIPVVNRNLLDKTVREYYINYVIQMFERGMGRVYRTRHSQWYDKLTRTTAFNLHILTPGVELARCGRSTCIGCKKLPTCNKYIWPQYERLRAEAIEEYQKIGEETIIKSDKKKRTFEEIINEACERREELKDKSGRISDAKIMLMFGIGKQKANIIAREMRDRYSSNST